MRVVKVRSYDGVLASYVFIVDSAGDVIDAAEGKRLLVRRFNMGYLYCREVLAAVNFVTVIIWEAKVRHFVGVPRRCVFVLSVDIV